MGRVEEIREREQKATKGPWTLEEETEFTADGEPDEHILIYVRGLDRSIWDREWADEADWDSSMANADFITHAREDIPFLLAEVASTKLPRGNWPVMDSGYYWVRMLQGWTVQYLSDWGNRDGLQWVGPIPEPEEE